MQAQHKGHKNPNVKKANVELEYTPEQVLELKRCATDPVYFIKTYVKIQHPQHGAVKFDMYDYQERMVRAYQENRYSIVMASRQVGKSVTSGAYILWYALFNFDKTILIASNLNKNAMEMIHRIRFAYEYVPHWLKPGVLDDGWNKFSLRFDNGSRIESTATSSDSGRGMSISLLFLDEFAFVRPNIQDEFWTSISPTLATGGSCIVTSTPNNDDDIFATLWNGAELGVNGFFPITVEWTETPGRDEKFKDQEIAKIGQRKWDREYELKFISADDLLIDAIVLNNLKEKTKRIEPIKEIKGIKFFKEIEKDKIYIVGVDPATGVSKDFSVFEVFELQTMIQVAEYRSNSTSTNDLYILLKNLLLYLEKRCKEVYFSIEANGVGEGIISLYEADDKAPLEAEFVSEEGPKKRGFMTTPKSKRNYCVTFKEAIEKNRTDIRSKVLVTELKSFVRKHGSYSARPGSSDDTISASIVCMRVIDTMATFDPSAFDTLYGIEAHGDWSDDETGEYTIRTEDDEPLPMTIG